MINSWWTVRNVHSFPIFAERTAPKNAAVTDTVLKSDLEGSTCSVLLSGFQDCA